MEEAEEYIQNDKDADFLTKRYIDTTLGTFFTLTLTF